MDRIRVFLFLITIIILVYIYDRISSTMKMTPGLKQLLKFLEKYKPDILLIMLLIFMVLMYIKDLNITLSTPVKTKKKLKSVLTIETMDTMTTDVEKKNEDCNKLNEKNCNMVDFCIYGNNKCVVGDQHGSKYKVDDLDKWYFKNKCYGKCDEDKKKDKKEKK